MATATKSEKTKEQVDRLHKEGKSPQEIAASLDKTPATIYNHLRNLGYGHGKRGRPPKSESNGKSEVRTRPRPGSKAQTKPGPKATTTKQVAKAATKVAKAQENGHDASAAERFPKIAEAIEVELREARSKVATLEGMLDALRG